MPAARKFRAFERSCFARSAIVTKPAADGLLAFLAAHETLEPSELETFYDLSAAWVAVARARQVDQQQLDDEYERSRNGEL